MKELAIEFLKTLLWEVVRAVSITICIHVMWNTIADAEIIPTLSSVKFDNIKFDAILTLGILNIRFYNGLYMFDNWVKGLSLTIISAIMFIISM